MDELTNQLDKRPPLWYIVQSIPQQLKGGPMIALVVTGLFMLYAYVCQGRPV